MKDESGEISEMWALDYEYRYSFFALVKQVIKIKFYISLHLPAKKNLLKKSPQQ